MIGCDDLGDVFPADNLSNLHPRCIGLPFVNSAQHAGIKSQVKHAQQDAAGRQVWHDIVFKTEAVCLRPPRWEGRKDDLTAYGVGVHVWFRAMQQSRSTPRRRGDSISAPPLSFSDPRLGI